MNTRCARSLALANLQLILLGAASARGGTDTIFSDDFEPDFCLWSAISTPCVSESDVASAWTGETLQLCIPETTVGSSFSSYTICPGSDCLGSVNDCDMTATIDGASAAFDVLSVSFAVSIDYWPLKLKGVALGIQWGCTVEMTFASDIVVGLDAAPCSNLLFATGVSGAEATAPAPPLLSAGCIHIGDYGGDIEATLGAALLDALEVQAGLSVASGLTGENLCTP